MNTHFKPFKNAFTLIELLTVIGIIGFLASLILSALTGAKETVRIGVCLNNKKQLMLAWSMYSDEHEDYLTGNREPHGAMPLSNPPTNWVAPAYSWVYSRLNWSSDHVNTNTVYLTNPNSSQLAPYLKGQHLVYKCPSDNFISPLQKELGWRGRTFSYAMNHSMGPTYINVSSEIIATREWVGHVLGYAKTSQIIQPSKRWVLIDGHPDFLTGPKFSLLPLENGQASSPDQWFTELPASYHKGGTTLSFADGHGEYHKWQSDLTMKPVLYDKSRLYEFINPVRPSARIRPQVDYLWLAERAHDGSPY